MELSAVEQLFSNSSRSDHSFTEALKNSTAPFAYPNYEPLMEQQPAVFRVTKIVFYCIILLGSSLGNAFVIFTISCNIQMRTPSNFLILNLAVCDFITPVLSIPIVFALEENRGVWFFGNAGCKLLWPFATMTSTLAALTLAVIALDRYRVIMHPFISKLTVVKIKWIIGAICLFSLLIATPYSYVLSFDGLECYEKWPNQTSKKCYSLTLSMVQYFVPLSFMVAMYTLALKHLYTTSDKTSRGKTQKEKAVINNSKMVSSLSSPDFRKVSSTARLVRKLSSTMRRGRNEANKRATKMFLAIVVVFTVCMAPNQAVKIWADFSEKRERESSLFFKAVAIGCRLLTHSNSVCNPLIYAVFNRDFRRGFEKVLRQLLCIRDNRNSRDVNTILAKTLTAELQKSGTGNAQNGTQLKQRPVTIVKRTSPAVQYVSGL